ncbi:MAG: hypothetical protein EOO50_01965 [Flavobacterium sp.]|uniref:hypothetical protein n=1 Tax=Flavobacterium sp. TaxID=239 RepID=UPI0012059720|nr:hypothetical protein [Flavobacterium sp.]RZJ68208.1 MAG: hypothetical protein EOO50_01965 [Flavobacterium sp.]
MKKFAIILSLVALMASCKSKQKATTKAPTKPKNEVVTDARIPIADADQTQMKRAYDFGKRVLNACNTSRFKPFNSSEATPNVIANTSESKITKTCLKFRLKYGDFQDLNLVEIVHNKKDDTNVYRYKADYSKKIANKELRVIMNKDNKVTAIKSTDWVDKYTPIN